MGNGIMDSIQSYDSYSHWGHFWTKGSWRDLYDSTHTIAEKLLKASINAWHVIKWGMVILFAVSFMINGMFPPPLDWWMWLLYATSCIGIFGLGFNITHKKKKTNPETD